MNETAAAFTGCVAVIAAALAEGNVPSAGVVLIPDAVATAGAGAGMFIQAVRADFLPVEFSSVFFADLTAADRANVFVHKDSSVK